MDEKIIETKSCKKCNILFDITDKDLEFYKKVSPVFEGVKYDIPTPSLCPDCRAQLMLVSRNERNLYKGKCSKTGKNIVSIYSPDKSIEVYNQDLWWSDDWDAMDYGIDVNFEEDFFTQYSKVLDKVPRINLNSPMSENSEYSNQCYGNKNCYMVFCSGVNDECYFGMWNKDCLYTVDSLYVEYLEHCYEIISSIKCYKCFYSKNLEECSNIYMSRDLIGCKNCICCANLINREYCIFNKQYSKDEYEKKLKELNINNYSSLLELKNKFEIFEKKIPIKYYNGVHNEVFSGDYIRNSTQSFYNFNCRDNENTKYCRDSWQTKSGYDLLETFGTELNLLIEGSSFMTKCLYVIKSSNVSNSLYCSHCNFSNNLFGCVGLKNKSYCIFNKQYSKEEYNKLVPKIIEHMKSTGEWGEFFPAELSVFGYNETVAQEYFPLSKEEATNPPALTGIPYIKEEKTYGTKLGGYFNWSDYEAQFQKVEKVISAIKLPENISDIPDDILNWAIECEKTKKPFRIIKQELDFYRKHNLPIPRIHPDQRHLDRMNLRNSRKLYDRDCDKCHKNMKTSYAPDREDIVYCEKCYNIEVY